MEIAKSDSATILSALCKVNGKWGMYASLSTPGEDEAEVTLAAPWLASDPMLWFHLRVEGCVYLFFDTREEMVAVYEQTVGDDGPKGTNTYDGPARVYATTCDPNGNGITENT